MMRRWLFYGGFAAWLAIGILAVTLRADSDPLGPRAAQMLFGDARSIASAAPEGLLALARVLERLGFDVREHRRAGPPTAPDAVLVLLGADVLLAGDEIAALLHWLTEGGRFIYASPRLQVRVEAESETEPTDAEAGDEPVSVPEAPEPAADDEADAEGGAGDDEIVPLVDPVVTMLEANGVALAGEGGAAELWAVGAGRVAVLPEGGKVLSNRALGEQGLAAELPWLRLMLANRRAMLFDEARLGFSAPESLVDVLFASRFASALRLGILALLVAVIARGVRQMPAQPEPPAGARIFAEHLDAVADALATGDRVQLSAAALLQGTERRLAALSRTPAASAVLQSAQSALARRPTTACLARSAERLRCLEAELTKPGGKPA